MESAISGQKVSVISLSRSSANTRSSSSVSSSRARMPAAPRQGREGETRQCQVIHKLKSFYCIYQKFIYYWVKVKTDWKLNGNASWPSWLWPKKYKPPPWIEGTSIMVNFYHQYAKPQHPAPTEHLTVPALVFQFSQHMKMQHNHNEI